MENQDKLRLLESHQEKAPDDFVVRVMAALPDKPRLSWAGRLKSFWPERRFWAVPGMAGALAMLFFLAGLTFFQTPEKTGLVPVVLDLRAPSAKQVELVGTFSDWTPGAFRLKGPDALGYWVIDIKLPPGRYEYSFLIDGSRIVPDDDGAFLRGDGFGYKNSVLLLNDGLREFDQPYAFTPSEYTTMARSLPEHARAIMEPLFQNDLSNIASKHLFLKLQEGVLERAQPDVLKSAVHNRHAAFKKARALLTETDHGASIETDPTLLNVTAFALESGQDPSFLKDVLIWGKGKPSRQLAAVIETSESLHHAGLEPDMLSSIIKDCLSKDLNSRQMKRLTEQIMEQLQKGTNPKTIYDALWV